MLSNSKKNLRRQTALVTGATGFLGSHLVKALLQEGHRVVILKRSSSKIDRIRDIASQLICYDIDKCNLAQPFQDIGKIDVVIHTATNYGRNHESISSIFEANLAFPLRLLETATEFKTDIFVNTDTIGDKYLSSYSLAKKHFMEWGKHFADSGKINFLNIKLEYFFGPGEDDFKFTTYLIKSCLANVPEIKLTSGEQKRDLVYIDDVVSAYSLLLQRTEQCITPYQDYEVGSGKAITIRQFAETVHHFCNSKTVLNFGALPYRKNETMHSKANIEPLNQLGWSPQYSLEQALFQTIDFFQNKQT